VAREYLEKLFQATVHVPLPRPSTSFLGDLLTHGDCLPVGVAPADLERWILELIEPNPRKIKNFVAGLAAGWAVDGGDGVDFRHYLLVAYLRAVHPDVYRLLSHEPQHAAVLNKVLREKTLLPSDNSPVSLFLHRAFRHAFDVLHGLGDDPRRADTEPVVVEVIERLDRVRGDRAFVAKWSEWLRSDAGAAFDDKQVVAALARVLQPGAAS
jgi:hypothetical protein